ncbi:restriction endonuclease [Fulvivirgaceae bacterium BMA12]|uniref:Restriction endonuclease n=1 Tax=Agaribacillus aureus TaxID=3051825 RepID=A0ABT8LDD3_9BACT|nr:restriction endonuclease [Fulvivirgaceae bacterium BMA12]
MSTKRLSTYDKLFDKYFDKEIIKSGTKYEILAAMVLKHLIDAGKVIHDIKLIGQSTVKHQIDVYFEDNGTNRRILIECKDFDISQNPVGLGIIRDFSAVVDDVQPDEAFVFTCNDFTRDANKFAKHKGIKLAILREFQDKDMEGRIQKIILRFHILHATTPTVEAAIEETHYPKLKQDLEDEQLSMTYLGKEQPFYLNTPDGRFQFNEYVEKIWNEHPKDTEGPVELKHKLENSTIEVANRGGVPILGLILRFEVIHDIEIQEIVSDKVAELIVTGFKDEDVIIFDQDIERFEIDDDTGEIIKIKK